MGAKIQMLLQCDGHSASNPCVATTQTTATAVVGKRSDYAKLDVDAPEGWWVGRDTGGYGNEPSYELKCACPKHVEQIRGW